MESGQFTPAALGLANHSSGLPINTIWLKYTQKKKMESANGYERRADLVKILYSNIQSNERLRNNLFALYLAISAAFLGFNNQSILGTDRAIANTLLPGLVWVTGILFLGAFIRYKEMIRRDVDLTFHLQSQLISEDPDLSEMFDEYCERINTRHRRVVSVSTALVALTLVLTVVVLSMLIQPFLALASGGWNYACAIGLSLLVNLATFFFYGGSLDTFSDRVIAKNKND